MSNGDDSAEPEKLDPTSLAVVEEMPRGQVVTPTGLKTDGKVDGIVELEIPNLLPTDNVTEEREVKVRRTKIPVRITRIDIEVIDNGYIVQLPQAGRQDNMFGPDGSRHAFADKGPMLEFIGKVVGQVTYQYNESEIRETKVRGRDIPSIEAALEAGHDVVFDGHGPIMVVQK